MNVTIHHTPAHTTFDGHAATYAVCRDALTGRRVAMIQVVMQPDGGQQFRTMDRQPMPAGTTFTEALAHAMDAKRRSTNQQEEPEMSVKIARVIDPGTGLVDWMSEHWSLDWKGDGIRVDSIRCASEEELIAAVDVKLGDLDLEGREIFAHDDWVEGGTYYGWIGTYPIGWEPSVSIV